MAQSYVGFVCDEYRQRGDADIVLAPLESRMQRGGTYEAAVPNPLFDQEDWQRMEMRNIPRQVKIIYFPGTSQGGVFAVVDYTDRVLQQAEAALMVLRDADPAFTARYVGTLSTNDFTGNVSDAAFTKGHFETLDARMEALAANYQ